MATAFPASALIVAVAAVALLVFTALYRPIIAAPAHFFYGGAPPGARARAAAAPGRAAFHYSVGLQTLLGGTGALVPISRRAQALRSTQAILAYLISTALFAALAVHVDRLLLERAQPGLARPAQGARDPAEQRIP